ncbi:MAG: hypothetical protein ACP5SJ_03405 [Candidatus Micrarchaeia archaeon]
MRLQLSFEFLLYLVVASISLASALSFGAAISYKEHASLSNYSAEALASLINENLALHSSVFYAYVPKQACNSSAFSKQWQIYANVAFAKQVCLDSGSIERLRLQYSGNGSYILGVYQ